MLFRETLARVFAPAGEPTWSYGGDETPSQQVPIILAIADSHARRHVRGALNADDVNWYFPGLGDVAQYRSSPDRFQIGLETYSHDSFSESRLLGSPFLKFASMLIQIGIKHIQSTTGMDHDLLRSILTGVFWDDLYMTCRPVYIGLVGPIGLMQVADDDDDADASDDDDDDGVEARLNQLTTSQRNIVDALLRRRGALCQHQIELLTSNDINELELVVMLAVNRIMTIARSQS